MAEAVTTTTPTPAPAAETSDKAETPAAQDKAAGGSGSGKSSRNRTRKKNRNKFRDQKVIAAMAVAQINYYFSTENLCQDTFLRSHFDELGFMPIAMVCNFPTVACFQAGYSEILNSLKQSEVVEVDAQNETLRCRVNPDKWVFPNPPPRWIKQAPPPPMPAVPPPPLAASMPLASAGAAALHDGSADTDSDGSLGSSSAGTAPSIPGSPTGARRNGCRSSSGGSGSGEEGAKDMKFAEKVNPRGAKVAEKQDDAKLAAEKKPEKKKPLAPPPSFNMATDFPALGQ